MGLPSITTCDLTVVANRQSEHTTASDVIAGRRCSDEVYNKPDAVCESYLYNNHLCTADGRRPNFYSFNVTVHWSPKTDNHN